MIRLVWKKMTSESSSFKTGLGQGVGCLTGGFLVLLVLIFLGAIISDNDQSPIKVNPNPSTSSGSTSVDSESEIEKNLIPSGTWIVGSEIKPGIYRVAGYYAVLDENNEILNNDGVYSDTALTIAVIKESDSYFEVNGEAILIDHLPVYDPLANSVTEGTYLVGIDIQPGRYRVEDESYAYAARLDENLEIISNEGNSGNVLITIKDSDFAVQITGKISPI